MIRYPKRSHEIRIAEICRGDPVYGCNVPLAPNVPEQKASKAARAGLGRRPQPNRVLGAPSNIFRRNRFGRLNGPGHPSGAPVLGANGAL
jgi:hypothetical protein